jgi:hypothetical protein
LSDRGGSAGGIGVVLLGSGVGVSMSCVCCCCVDVDVEAGCPIIKESRAKDEIVIGSALETAIWGRPHRQNLEIPQPNNTWQLRLDLRNSSAVTTGLWSLYHCRDRDCPRCSFCERLIESDTRKVLSLLNP